MKLQYKIQALFILLILFLPAQSFALKSLSEDNLKSSTAQSGIGIAIDSFLMEEWQDSVTITNPDDSTSYITFSDIHTLIDISIGTSDTNGNDRIEFLTFDLGTISDSASPAYGKPIIAIQAPDIDMSMDTYIGGINFAGTDIGSASILGYSMHSFEVFMGAHDTGLDIEFSQALSIDSLSYNFVKKLNEKDADDPLNTLTFSGIHLYGSFTGDPNDPSTWSGSGMFKAGDIFDNNPVTIDIGSDNTEYWVIERDPVDGGNYSVPNPRNGSGFIAIRTGHVEGSLRVENVNMGGTDMGPVAIDGINLTNFYVEIPGRGLGKP